MSIRNMFDHKYPITNLHEVDLTFMHDDIDRMIEILESWEEIINELKAGLEELDSINKRVIVLESLTSGLNQAYSDIVALKKQVAINVSDIVKLRRDLAVLDELWHNILPLIYTYVNEKVKAEATSRKNGDYNLDIKIEKLRFDVYDDITILYQLVSSLRPMDVYNPVKGIREGFDLNNADIYQDLRYGGFTNAELSEFGISNDHVASLVHNNRDYALHAKLRFKRHWLFDPYSGRRMPHYNAISEVYRIGFSGPSNNSFYGQISADDKTNNDLADYIDNNQARYFVEL